MLQKSLLFFYYKSLPLYQERLDRDHWEFRAKQARLGKLYHHNIVDHEIFVIARNASGSLVALAGQIEGL